MLFGHQDGGGLGPTDKSTFCKSFNLFQSRSKCIS